MQFKGLEKTSLIEWPEKAVAVAYTGGCNFRCPFCQNQDLVLNPEKLPTISEEEIINYIDSRKKWLDGLMVTGGEPSIHPSLFNFADKVKEKKLDFGTETNGTNPKIIEKFLKENLIDRVALDIKAPLRWKKYKKATGTNDKKLLKKIKKTIKIIRNSNISYEFRTTVVPKLLEKEDMLNIGAEIQKTENYYLQQFVPENTLDKEYENLEPYSEEKLKEIKKLLKENYGLKNCKIRNL
ncbi:hypothetical protein AKJ56_01225 [candidate division MSBL1 archaeon SCGC-AAA382N08]|uniref:Radical SAM core domain-containing protein n=1 Tax=candidate division MSBL1 archaeon SCGC-AAA382N08 TaxID=1698285 RepID=A0A133VPX4_9EURY|nr:hypothetical protein AKJ56_01225 [candidate division MSBL1 archaeon SCGC-AAA382N08]